MNNITTTNGTNGNGKPAPKPTLPEYRVNAAKTYIEGVQEREHELYTVTCERNAAEVRIAELEAELDAMKRERLLLESRATSCLLERDRAKDQQVSLATIINSIQHLIAQSGVPSLHQQAEVQAEPAEG